MLKTFFIFLLSQNIFQAFGCGRYEFYMFEDLPDSVKKAAEQLNYNEDLWNFVGTNPIEKVALDDLINGITLVIDNDEKTEVKFGDREIEALKELDLYDDQSPDPGQCWDHFVSHYMGYSWDEIMAPLKNPFGNDLSESVMVLGWTKDMWDSNSTTTGEVPASECKAWFDLTSDEQWALQSMGWTGMKWMHYPLDPRCGTPQSGR